VTQCTRHEAGTVRCTHRIGHTVCRLCALPEAEKQEMHREYWPRDVSARQEVGEPNGTCSSAAL
jgi:hypothetical protein